jgi:hypothetical protein
MECLANYFGKRPVGGQPGSTRVLGGKKWTDAVIRPFRVNTPPASPPAVQNMPLVTLVPTATAPVANTPDTQNMPLVVPMALLRARLQPLALLGGSFRASAHDEAYVRQLDLSDLDAVRRHLDHICYEPLRQSALRCLVMFGPVQRGTLAALHHVVASAIENAKDELTILARASSLSLSSRCCCSGQGLYSRVLVGSIGPYACRNNPDEGQLARHWHRHRQRHLLHPAGTFFILPAPSSSCRPAPQAVGVTSRASWRPSARAQPP